MTSRSSLPAQPSAPIDLVAVAVNCSQVILAWTECGNSVLGFNVERAAGAGIACRFSKVGNTVSHITVFCDDTVASHKSYSYRVHAWNASGESFSSNVVEVTTPSSDAGRSAGAD